MDALVYTPYAGLAGDLIRVQEKAATAKLCNTLFNLPEVLKGLEGEFAKQKAKKLEFVKSQEGGKI